MPDRQLETIAGDPGYFLCRFRGTMMVIWLQAGRRGRMLSAIFAAIAMILGLILDIVTLPFRLAFALLRGADFEFRRFSRRRAV